MAREESIAVRATPDTSGFAAKLREEVARASSRTKIKVPAKVDAAGLRAELAKAIRTASHNQKFRIPIEIINKGLRKDLGLAIDAASLNKKFRIPVVIDNRGLRASLDAAMAAAAKGKRFNVPVEAHHAPLPASHILRQEDRLGRIQLQAEEENRRFDAARQKAIDTRVAKEIKAREQFGRLQQSAYAEDSRFNARREADGKRRIAEAIKLTEIEAARARDLPESHQLSLADKLGRMHHRANKENELFDLKREASVRKQVDERRKMFSFSNISSSLGSGAGLLNFGGAGVKPMNALIAAAVALSPVLVSMAASAGYASLSIAALGAAGIGAVAGIAALAIGFGGVLGTFKAYLATTKAQATSSKDGAVAEQSRARAIRDAEDGVKSALRGVGEAQRRASDAQLGINRARKEATADLRELRDSLKGLALDERGAAIGLQRALEEQRRVRFDGRSTGLDQKEADLSVDQARDRLNRTSRQRRETEHKINVETRQGINNSTKVKDATKQYQEALRGVADAQRQVAKARLSLLDAQTKATNTTTKATAAENQFQQLLKERSPIGRRALGILIAQVPKFKEFTRAVETSTLPGFISAFIDLSRSGKRSVSTVTLMSRAIRSMGASISRTTALFGKQASSSPFKRDLAKITDQNRKAFDRFGQASVIALKPIMRIFAAASPLLVRFGDYLVGLANKFDASIGKYDKNHGLENFFRGAGDELAKWWNIARDIGGTLLAVLTASLPSSGDSLVDRLGRFTALLRKNAESEKGKESIRKFFEFFDRIDYGRLAKIVANLVVLAATMQTLAFLYAGPKNILFVLLAAFAQKNPDQALKALQSITGVIASAVDIATQHPQGVAALLAVLAAYKGLSAVTGKKLPDLFGSLFAGKGGVAGKIGQLFASRVTVANMTVTAGRVTVLGGTGTPGVTPPGTPITPGSSKPGSSKPGLTSKVKRAGRAAGDFLRVAALIELMSSVEDFLPPDFQKQLNRSTAGQASIEAAKATGFKELSKVLTLFDEKGLADKLMSVFSGEVISKSVDAAKSDLTRIGASLSDGLTAGFADGFGRFLNWIEENTLGRLRKAFASAWGIASPSTETMVYGRELINGVYVGMTSRFKVLIGAIGGIGAAIVAAITKPFNTLAALLVGPIERAKSVLNSLLIVPVNALLKAVGSSLALPTFKAPAAGKVTNKLESVKRKANGGRIVGQGSRTSDSIPLMASRDEYVLRATAADRIGPKALNTLNSTGSLHAALRAGDMSNGVAFRSRGGPISIDAFARQGHLPLDAAMKSRIPAVQSFLKAQNGKPYVWASAGPGGYDCSGIISAAYNLIKARNPYSHTFSTHSEGQYFKSGVSGPFNVGWSNPGDGGSGGGRGDVGHTAGNLGGLGFESNGSQGVVIGGNGFKGGKGSGGGGGGGGGGDAFDFGLSAKLGKIASAGLKRAASILPKDLGTQMLLSGVKSVPGALASLKILDSGGSIEPGFNAIYNGTGHRETVRTREQENALGARTTRLDPRDLRALAQMIAAGTSRPINMDGLRVAEAVNQHSVLPMGV